MKKEEETKEKKKKMKPSNKRKRKNEKSGPIDAFVVKRGKKDIDTKEDVKGNNTISNSPKSNNENVYTKIILIKGRRFNEGDPIKFDSINLRTNDELRVQVLGRNIELKNDIFVFDKFDDLEFAHDDPKKSLFPIGFEKPNDRGPFYFMIGSKGFIQELIKTGNNFVHELIYTNPVKMFIDIDWELKPEDDFEKSRTEALVYVRKFEESFMQYIKEEFEKLKEENLLPEIKPFKHDWLVLDASKKSTTRDKPSKVSFHVINNSKSCGIPIYFKHITHVAFALKTILESAPVPENSFKVDPTFDHFKKGCRMYKNAKRGDLARVFNQLDKKTTALITEYNDEVFESSILQVNSSVPKFYEFAVATEFEVYHPGFSVEIMTKYRNSSNQSNSPLSNSFSSFLPLSSFNNNNNNNNNDETTNYSFDSLPSIENRKFQKRNDFFHISSGSFINKNNPFAQTIIDEVIKILKDRGTFKVMKGEFEIANSYNFTHIERDKTKYSPYTIQKANDNSRIIINLQATSPFTCLLQNHHHHSKTSMRLYVSDAGTGLYLFKLFCLGGKDQSDHKNNSLIVSKMINKTSDRLKQACEKIFDSIKLHECVE